MSILIQKDVIQIRKQIMEEKVYKTNSSALRPKSSANTFDKGQRTPGTRLYEMAKVKDSKRM